VDPAELPVPPGPGQQPREEKGEHSQLAQAQEARKHCHTGSSGDMGDPSRLLRPKSSSEDELDAYQERGLRDAGEQQCERTDLDRPRLR
jgi:hypothetical protein